MRYGMSITLVHEIDYRSNLINALKEHYTWEMYFYYGESDLESPILASMTRTSAVHAQAYSSYSSDIETRLHQKRIFATENG